MLRTTKLGVVYGLIALLIAILGLGIAVTGPAKSKPPNTEKKGLVIPHLGL
jgi:hypothetical protein